MKSLTQCKNIINAVANSGGVMNIIKNLKPMRVILVLSAIATILLRPEPGSEVFYEGAQMFQTLLIPVLAPILFMLLLLDSLMSTIWLTQTTGEEKQRYRMNIIVNLSVVALLLYFWIPFISALGK